MLRHYQIRPADLDDLTLETLDSLLNSAETRDQEQTKLQFYGAAFTAYLLGAGNKGQRFGDFVHNLGLDSTQQASTRKMSHQVDAQAALNRGQAIREALRNKGEQHETV